MCVKYAPGLELSRGLGVWLGFGWLLRLPGLGGVTVVVVLLRAVFVFFGKNETAPPQRHGGAHFLTQNASGIWFKKWSSIWSKIRPWFIKKSVRGLTNIPSVSLKIFRPCH